MIEDYREEEKIILKDFEIISDKIKYAGLLNNRETLELIIRLQDELEQLKFVVE